MEKMGPGGSSTAHVLRKEPWCWIMRGKEEETAWYTGPNEKRENCRGMLSVWYSLSHVTISELCLKVLPRLSR